MGVLDRVGRLGSTNIRLAKWRPAEGRYQRRLSPVSPSEGFIAGDQFQLNAVPDTQVWYINEWSGGEGNDVYSEDQRDVYHRSSGVRPKPTGEGLILGALGAATVTDVPATFNDGNRFVFGTLSGLPAMWAGVDTKMTGWVSMSEYWFSSPLTGASAGQKIASGADVSTFFIFTGHSSKDIWKWDGTTQTKHYNGAAGFSYPPILTAFRGKLFALDGDDLYEVSLATTDTRTLKVDVAGTSAYLQEERSWSRLTVSDKGPVWVQRTNSGEVFLWEYNDGASTGGIIGSPFHRYAYPYDVAFVSGVYVLAYRATLHDSLPGDAFLHVQRGDTRSVVPIRSLTGSTASKPVLIAGTIGSDLMVYFDGAVWAYNMDTGGLHMFGLKTTTAEPSDAAVFGGAVFLAGVTSGGNTKAVEKVDPADYMSSGTYESGRFDVRYPGLPKLLTEVTVNTEPLPASTSVSVAVSTDGGSYVNLAGSHDVDGATSKTFVASDATTSIIGREFELKLTLNGTSTATPTVRSVTAVVTGAAHLEEWVMELDVSDIDSPGSQSGWKLVDDLRTLAASQQVVTFLNPWEQRDVDAADSIPVRVMDVIVPQGGRGDAYATVRVRRTQLVVAS